MDGPKQILWNILSTLVWPSILEHHHHEEKCHWFLLSYLPLFYPMQ